MNSSVFPLHCVRLLVDRKPQSFFGFHDLEAEVLVVLCGFHGIALPQLPWTFEI